MNIPDERRQFRILYRDFLSRMVDLELISVGGDTRDMIVRFGSMMAALSFMIAYLMVPRYLTTTSISHEKLVQFAWGDEEFLISLTITVAGLCAVMAWNTVFPDRRDSLILGLIPVRLRTMIVARLAAIATALGAAIGVINIVTGVTFPFVLRSGVLDAVRGFLTWWLIIAAAGAFTFCAGLAVQGVASQLLPWRWFPRVSGLLQIAVLFGVLGAFFLAPPFAEADPQTWIPSFWFVGLLHELRGEGSPLFDSLSARALIGLGVVVPLATILYVLSWSRNVRRIVESPEILPARRSRFTTWLATVWSPAPFERAILLFTARTIARSRQHRLMLAIYGGFALAISLAFSASLLSASHKEWIKPNAPFLLTGFLVLSGSVVGMRTIFALPITLPANWIFRMTSVHRPVAYFDAVRKSFYTVAVLPVLAGSAVVYLTIWPGRPAFEHILILGTIGVLMVERSLYTFRKIPFACSWLPGHSQGKMKAGIWACVFIVFAIWAALIELWSFDKAARVGITLFILGGLALRARYRTSEFAAEPDNRVQFEDTPAAEIFALDLRLDGTWSNDEAYVETIDPNMGRSLAMRLLPFAAGFAILTAAGFAYEKTAEWRDRRNFPQIGRSVDIGGRSLNIYCSGTGSPAVIFDTGGNQPGYSWLFVQPQVAKMTRSCWYDRAGYGWSDPASGARTSADVANDLHILLRAAGVPPPYVLVGHSFGGFTVRVYADRYRNETAGLVLVESADEHEIPDTLPEPLQSPVQQYVPWFLWKEVAAASEFLVHVGALRLFDDGPPPARPPMTVRQLAIIHALQYRAATFDATTQEGLDHEESAAQVRAIRGFGNIPLIVVTGGRMPRLVPDNPVSVEMVAYMRNRIYGSQARLANLSTRGRQIILERIGHPIPTDDPVSIVEAVKTVLAETR